MKEAKKYIRLKDSLAIISIIIFSFLVLVIIFPQISHYLSNPKTLIAYIIGWSLSIGGVLSTLFFFRMFFNALFSEKIKNRLAWIFFMVIAGPWASYLYYYNVYRKRLLT
jgi:hypothetical protein